VRLEIRRAKFFPQNADEFAKQLTLWFRRKQPVNRRSFLHRFSDGLPFRSYVPVFSFAASFELMSIVITG